MRLRAEAPAKINRELRVGPRRADGYHDIRSRFVTIDLTDLIEAEQADRFELVSASDEVPADGSNLVSRAARALAEVVGIEPRVRLRLSKRIPVGAGLGGGSSDAAVTLRLLCRLWEIAISDDDLSRVAASLGSDVPFFLSGGEADVAGRGEIVEPRPSTPREGLTLLVPPFSLSTAEVYAAFDRIGGASKPPDRLEIEESGRFFGPNELERAVVALRPEMGEYLASVREIARECAVTGSGSTIVIVGAPRESLPGLAARHPGAVVLTSRTMGRDEYRRRTTADDDSESPA